MTSEQNQICDSELWNTDLFWSGPAPVLTSCFQQTVLVWLPCGFLWLTSSIHLIWKSRHRSTAIVWPYPWTLVSIVKIAISVILIFLTCLELLFQVDMRSSFSEQGISLMAFTSLIIKIATYALTVALQILQKRRRKLSSSKLFLFWLLLSICEVWTTPIFAVLKSDTVVEIDKAMYVLKSTNFALILSQLVLSAFTDPSHSYLQENRKDPDSVTNQSLLCRVTFSYMDRLIWYGHKNSIILDDLEKFGSSTNAHHVSHHLLNNWSKEENKGKCRNSRERSSETSAQKTFTERGKPSLFVALVKTIWPAMIFSGVLEILISFIILTPPLILDMLIRFTDSQEPQWHGYLFSFVLFLTSSTATFLSVNNLHILILASLVPRLGVPVVVYKKCLKLSSAARRDYSVGEMCNLLSVDSQKIFETVWFANLAWACPLRIAITTALVWKYLGLACLSGFAVMILLMPLTGFLARRIQILQGGHLELKDNRLRQLNEIFNGIKILKLFAWEVPFMEKIKGVRQKEVIKLRRIAMYKAAIVFIWVFAPFLIAICSFVTFVVMSEDNVLTPSIAFVSLTLFNSLRQTLSLVPEVVSKFIQCYISLGRLQKFLLCEELMPDRIGNNPSAGNSVAINNGMFSWSSEEPPFLKDVQVAIPKGSLVAIVGRVGSGKSALLSAILGEMWATQGSVDVKGTVAYVSQQAWIQNATLRNNVLFMKVMDSSKYDEVLDMCCLKPDLKVLPAGDLTEIGEKGVNLSGGQKQRVSLARAVYQNSDVYIFDDPLSAVDSHVGTHIFKHIIGPNGKLKEKTRILVTHDLSILPEVDHILVMSNGRITESGKYYDLMSNKGDFSAFVEEHLRSLEENESDEDAVTTEKETEEGKAKLLKSQMSTEDLKKQMIRLGSRLSRAHSTKDPEPATHKMKRARFIDDETMQTGRVKGDTFLSYFKNASWKFTVIMLISYIGYQSFEIGSSFWLSKWSSDAPLPDGSQNIELRNTRIGVYGLLGLGQGVCVLFATFVLAIASMRASVLFHVGMLSSVMHCPMLFFDTTPIGRILNRFGKDINTVDVDIPEILNSIVLSMITVLGTLVVISISNPLFVAIMAPLSVIYIIMQNFYMRTSRQVRRWLSVTLSPILSCFSETVQGTNTIRAFDAQDYFNNRQCNFLDKNTATFMNSAALNRWLGIRLEMIGNVVVLITALLAVAEKDNLNAGIVGLTLSYALGISQALNLLVKHFTTLENRMVSVERINEYSVLTPEATWKKETDNQVHTEWPTEGEVTFQDYSMSYRENSDLVLKGVNLKIKPQEKVGVVGRTGAGKSSLAVALFRTVESAEGSITVDKFDIASVGLHTLRSGLTIIPQDPVLFSGTLRMNLDPLEMYSDADLWNALDQSHLKMFVSSLDSKLDYHVTEGGDNLSVGQRQQLCLARALLKKTKILILDEATAAMDMETDKLIQSTIRTEFETSTVITIAHRLHTILDYDRIIVMDNGKIVEDGKPDFLLQNPNSYFYQLGKDAGLL